MLQVGCPPRMRGLSAVMPMFHRSDREDSLRFASLRFASILYSDPRFGLAGPSWSSSIGHCRTNPVGFIVGGESWYP